MRQIRDVLVEGPVIAVTTIERIEDALPLARALVRGGLRVLEVTLRSEAALPSLAAIARELPEIIAGAGTVLTEEQVNRAADAGAQFLVSPGLTQNLARAASSADIALLPGAATASDIMRGLELGFDAFKFFPAEIAGGIAALTALERPFPSVRFCPTGGVTAENAGRYLAVRNVASVGGSWLAPKEAIDAADWRRVERLAREAVALRQQ